MFRRIWSHRATVSVFRTRRNAPSEICSNTPPTAMNLVSPCFSQTLTRFRENQASISVVRFISSKASDRKQGKSTDKTKNEITNVEEDPFSAPTYNIPEKPVTFVEGASYSVIILAGLGIAAAAGYAVFKELIFQPKEYKIYSKALKRIQDDGQVRVRIGFPITGYGQESRNRAARQRIPNRVWTDEDGLEHVEVNFYIRGPHGHGKVFSEMFKGPADNEWKFTNLIVEIRAPSSAQLILESYVPDYSPNK
ncbi:putative mitochondrial import inner membrane translocase subunit Tim21 [Lupinus albus]|uniref:Mitochondrial import inner membrane translocase subunit Tim21 n=1 Tax=Lupinus albus TaxID=3870 RepID=A0A6A4QXH7_LUPAL|nr:putative mitochondrial import inner membrane translocase subunit Tim21 [Lupinus albus]